MRAFWALTAIALTLSCTIACDNNDQPNQNQDQATTPPVEIRSAPRTPDDPPVRYSRIDVGRFPGDVGGSPLVKQTRVVTLPAWWPTSGIGPRDGHIRPTDQSPRYRLVGRSDDGAWVALRPAAGDQTTIWLKSERLVTRGLTSAGLIAELPVLADGPGSGPKPITASHDWFSIGIRAWPGHENGFRIVQRWGQPPTEYPVVGRSLNGRYLAIRLGPANPPVVWVERGSVGVNADLTEAPVLVASGTEAIGPNGEFTAVQRMSRWQWRDDNTIVGTNSSGVWHWDPAANILRRITADSFKPVFSPDGAYAALGIGRQREDGSINWQGERTVRIWSLDHDRPPQVFEDVNRFGFTHHPTDPSLHWSPDSRYLLSYRQGGGEAQPDRWFVLNLDGGQSELPLIERAWPLWLADSTLAFLGFAGTRLLRSSPTGELLQDLDLGRIELSNIHWSPTALIGLAATPDGWVRIELEAEQVSPLPTPLDRGRWAAQWSPDGRSALFASEPGELYLYWAEANRADQVTTIELPSARYPRLRALWSRNSEHVAVTGADGELYIVRRQSGQATVVEPETKHVFRPALAVAWSPDAERLLTRIVRVVDQVDQHGYAAFPQPLFGPETWLYAEFQVRDRSGTLLQTYRAYTNGCGEYVRGEWSPNGQWLTFAGDIWDCN